MKPSVENPVPLSSLLRLTGIGVAVVELVYLVFWMGLDLGLLASAPFVHALDAPQGSLTQLVEGMTWAAVIGAAGSLLATLAVYLVGAAIGRRVVRRTGQALARSLVVRNQTR